MNQKKLQLSIDKLYKFFSNYFIGRTIHLRNDEKKPIRFKVFDVFVTAHKSVQKPFVFFRVRQQNGIMNYKPFFTYTDSIMTQYLNEQNDCEGCKTTKEFAQRVEFYINHFNDAFVIPSKFKLQEHVDVVPFMTRVHNRHKKKPLTRSKM
jgi:hypothetical protein